VFDISRPRIHVLDLQLFRIFYCLLLLHILIQRQQDYLENMSNSLNFNPIPLFEMMGIGRFDLLTFEWLYIALIWSLTLALIGLATRPNLLVSAVLFFLVRGQLLSLTKSPDSNYVYHSHNLVVFVLIILAMDSNMGKRSLITRWPRLLGQMKTPSISSHSLNLVIISMGMVYFGASYVRLVTSGLGWMDGYTLKSFLMMSYFSDGSLLAYKLAQHHYVCIALSILLMAFELGFIFAFFFWRPYVALFVGSCLLHYSILLVMNINFFNYHGFALVAYLCLPPFSCGSRLSRACHFILGRMK
jgi:hypothetical protein